MIERALDAGVPCRRVTGDEVYGGDRRLRFWLEQRRSAGDGAKGPRPYDWAWQPLWRWQPTAEERARGHGRVVRRSLEDPSELAYYVAFAPREDTTLAPLIQVAGRRWAIEVGFERAKQDCGLDEYEGRTWDAWHRHITLALLA